LWYETVFLYSDMPLRHFYTTRLLVWDNWKCLQCRQKCSESYRHTAWV